MEIEVYNLAIPDIPREKTIVDFTADKFQIFGSDNLFPQQLAEITRTSTAHRAILKYKQIFTIGEGFNFDENNKPLEEFINHANEAETLRNVYKKIIQDWLIFGNYFVEFVTDKKNSFFNVFHKDVTKIRLNKDGDGVIIHPDWRQYQSRKSLAKEIPLYPEFEKGKDDSNLHSILHVKNYEPEFSFYGLPDWVAAMDAAGIVSKTNKWNLSRLDNSFQPSGIMELTGDADNEEIKKGKKEIQRQFTGEGKNSKLIVVTKEQGAEGIKYTPLTQTQTGDWIELHKMATDELVMAHNWFRSLSGIGEAGQLGNTQQIRNEYEIAKATIIADIRESTLEPLLNVLSAKIKIDFSTLEIINLSPVNVIDLLDTNLFITKGEGRQILGYPVDENNPIMQEFIKKEGSANIKIV